VETGGAKETTRSTTVTAVGRARNDVPRCGASCNMAPDPASFNERAD
jgi:hypothetical protein